MTFKQTMKEEAVDRYPFSRGLGQLQWNDVNELIETTINATLKAVEESLGEEDTDETWDKCGEYIKGAHNTLHRKLKATLLELGK